LNDIARAGADLAPGVASEAIRVVQELIETRRLAEE
jgi:hypothetical protein